MHTEMTWDKEDGGCRWHWRLSEGHPKGAASKDENRKTHSPWGCLKKKKL